MPPFRLVDHTADLAIESEASSEGGALAEAAMAVTAVLTGCDDPRRLGRPEREARFMVEAPDRASLAVAFLSEILWLNESQDLLWVGGGVEVEAGQDGLRARAAANVLRHDPARHGRGVEVKAVTYHDLAFARDGALWRLRAVLDI